MNETEEKIIDPLKNAEDLEALKSNYEAEITKKSAKIEEYKNVSIKFSNEILEKDSKIKRLENEIDDLRTSILRSQRVEREKEKIKKGSDLLNQLNKR